MMNKKKYMIRYYETIEHIYEVEANNEDEAIDLSDIVYYEGNESPAKKVLSHSVDNEMIEVMEIQ